MHTNNTHTYKYTTLNTHHIHTDRHLKLNVNFDHRETKKKGNGGKGQNGKERTAKEREGRVMATHAHTCATRRRTGDEEKERKDTAGRTRQGPKEGNEWVRG